jgi:enoyl-CoA hydratase
MKHDGLTAERQAGVLRLTIDRADKHNALSRGVLHAIRDEITAAAAGADLKCVVIGGAGSRYFAAGGDLLDLASVRSEAQAAAMVEDCRGALDAVRHCAVPVVALLNGDAIGGGAELAVACDFRVLRAGAHIGFIQGRLAITAAWGGSADLYPLVGPSRALRMITRCEPVAADVALEWGLADAVSADADTLEATLQEFIAPMLECPAALLRDFKAQAIAARRTASWERLREVEREGLVRSWVHDDHWTAVDRRFGPKKEQR